MKTNSFGVPYIFTTVCRKDKYDDYLNLFPDFNNTKYRESKKVRLAVKLSVNR